MIILNTSKNTRTGMRRNFMSVRGRCAYKFVKCIFTTHTCEQTKGAALP